MKMMAQSARGDPESVSILHTGLGTVFKGISTSRSSDQKSSSVAQFRGIKFACIPARFRRAVLHENFPPTVDATDHGPICPQQVGPIKFEDLLNGTSPDEPMAAGQLETPVMDEFECLNLVITAPVSENTEKIVEQQFPVMIYIHGGGNLVGANSFWFNDGRYLVEKSVNSNLPVVVVALKYASQSIAMRLPSAQPHNTRYKYLDHSHSSYRLSALGWLSSQTLREDNTAFGDVGVGNYGCHDVHLGIEWVYRNIRGFGGDPSNITIFGESAGGFAVENQIHSRLPCRFSQAILQSGVMSSHLSSPLSPSDQGILFDLVKAYAHVNSVGELRDVSVDVLLQAFADAGSQTGFSAVPTIDGETFTQSWAEHYSFANDDFRIIIGHTTYERSLFEILANIHSETKDNHQSFDSIRASFRAQIEGMEAAGLCEVYGLQYDTSPARLNQSLMKILEDIVFVTPVNEATTRFTRKGLSVYRYIFDEPNPFKGVFSGKSNHALDLPYLFGPASTFVGVENMDWEQNIQDSLQRRWLLFAHGMPPWSSVSDGKFLTFGPRGVVNEHSATELIGNSLSIGKDIFGSLELGFRAKLSLVVWKHAQLL
ncbi:Alpha/Beta hydrolase protein [Aspergillus californicus]